MATNIPSISIDLDDPPSLMHCIYAISGTYGLLPRLLYYITLCFAIFGRSKEWLIVGALVSALTYAGTAAVHAFALTTSKTEIFDLDIMGTWAILSTAALAYIAMMNWSSTLRDSRAKTVLILWGVLIGLSLIAGRVEMFDIHLSDPEPACFSKSGKLLTYPAELLSSQFNCTYQCFSARKPMRQWSEVIAIPKRMLDNRYSRFQVILVGPIQFAAYAAISFDARQHTPSEHCTRIVMKYLNPNHHDDIYKLIYSASSAHWYGGYFALFKFARRSRWTWRKAAIAFLTLPWFVIGLLVDLFALPMLVVNVILNEVSILAGDLPTNEANYAIGQWGPWVSSILVLIAAIVNQYLEYQEKVKKRVIPKEDVDARRSSFSTVEQSILEEQTIGVVKPSVAHVDTLKDMGDWLDNKGRHR